MVGSAVVCSAGGQIEAIISQSCETVGPGEERRGRLARVDELSVNSDLMASEGHGDGVLEAADLAQCLVHDDVVAPARVAPVVTERG